MNNIPRSAARFMIRAEQKRQVRQAIRQVAPGEKIMGALMPGRGFAFPGGWSQDRIAQVQQMRDWTGVCIDKLASLCAQLVPNAAYVRPQQQPTTQKVANRFDPRLNRMQYLNCEGYSFNNNPYRAKALGVIKPHEELEPLPQDHPIVRLIQDPNDWETQYEHDYEIIMFLMLTGVAYDWMVPDPMFTEYPGELWCIPSHWVWPRSSGGQVVSPQHPNADRLIEYYEIRPWGGLGTAGVIRIPPEEMIRYAHKSPINKIDGLARTQIGSLWIDSDNSIAMCQRSMMTNGIYPSFWLEMGEGFSDLTDDQVDRIEAKIYAKLGGENRFGRPFISSQGTKPHPLVFPPNEYAFADSGDQSRNRIVSLFGLNLPVLGLSEDQTFGSVLANLMSVSVHTLKPLLTYMGQAKTKFFASKFSTRPDPIKMWYDDPTPVDPQQLNEDIKTDFGCGAITPNMILTLRGRPVYEHGGDDPILPMGSVPMPLNTGIDLSGLAELVPLLGRQENPASEEEEAEAGLGSPQVEEPNGKPSKPKKRWGGRLKEFNESDHPRGQPDNAGQFGPGSGVPSVKPNSNGTVTATKPAKPKKSRVPEQKPNEKAARAKEAHVLVDKSIQRYAEEYNEPRMAKLLGGVSHPDSEPMDITAKNGDLVEMKTLVKNGNDKITMDSYSQIRKIAREQETGKTFHTVISDDSKVYNPNGKPNEKAGRTYYYRRGVAGSARIGNMYKCKDETELKNLMVMSDKQLPPAAQRTDAKHRVGKWKAVVADGRKGFRNSKTGVEFWAKK